MPVAFEVTKASNSERTETQKLLNQMEKEKPEHLEACKYFMADKGYDGAPLITWLKDRSISPIIDIRNCWKDGEETYPYRNTPLVYDYQGNIWYVDENGNKTEMVYKGYDKSTDSQRYGFRLQAQDRRIFRIKCEED